MIGTPKKTRCLIVDDEPNAIKIIEEYLKTFNHLELYATAGNAFDALIILQQGEVDLLFLDIQMPMITGMQLLSTLKHRPAVIITTAHRDYAAEAFDFEVIDYLLKPVSSERFGRAIQRHLESIIKKAPVEMSERFDQSILVIRSDRKEIRIPWSEILYLQAMGDYVILMLTTGEKHMTLETLTGISARLPSQEFARIHRSYIINRRHIRAIGKNKAEVGQATLPISKNYRSLI